MAESVRTSTPSIAELRAATQPPEIFARNSGEHWAGRLYIRRLSPYATKLFLRLGLSPNAVTWLFIAAGVAAAGVLAVDDLGIAGVVGAFLLIQLQILLDCSDGEVARWQGRFSAKGIYLDRIGHYVTEAGLPIALGIRADEVTLGLVLAVLVLLIKSETALVHVARAESGQPPAADRAEVAAPRGGVLRRARHALRAVPFYRAFVAMEFTLLASSRRRSTRPTRCSSCSSRSRRSPRSATWSRSSPPTASDDAIGCVVLTTGTGRTTSRLALESLLRQPDVEADIVVVGNGWEPVGLPDGVRGARARGGPRHPRRPQRGRRARSRRAHLLPRRRRRLRGTGRARPRRRPLRRRPDLGLAQLRVVARDGGRAARDWVPRLRVGDPARGSEVTAVWEGAVAMPRDVFDQVGGWPEEFRFVHEGIDLAWRVMDAGYRVEYLGERAVLHPEPAAVPARHGYSLYYGMRNKVWLARRHLPLPLGVIYTLSFALRRAVGLALGRGRARAGEGTEGRRPAAVRHAPAAQRADDLAHDAGGPPTRHLRRSH